MRKPLILFLVFTIVLSLSVFQLIKRFGREDDISEATNAQSIISVDDILNNPELETGVLKAVKDNDYEAIEELQNKAVEIAIAAGFNESQMKRVSGPIARDFLVFRAKRELFYQEFLERYQNLSYIDDLKLKYPEAQSIFVQADSLIEQRDKTIVEIAQILADENSQNYEDFLDAARVEWASRQHQIELK